MDVRVGSVILAQVERPRSTDFVLGSVSAVLGDRVQVEGTVITRIDRATGESTEPDDTETVFIPKERLGEQEAEVLQW